MAVFREGSGLVVEQNFIDLMWRSWLSGMLGTASLLIQLPDASFCVADFPSENALYVLLLTGRYLLLPWSRF